MKKIITIQHTESMHHINGMVGSWTDWELSELGKKQAENIALHLKEELTNQKCVLYSSDLLRAKQVAELIGKYLGITPILRQELRERNLGKCCGQSVKWLKKFSTTERYIDDKCFSDAESRREEWNRLKPFFDEIMNNEEEIIIIVSHGDLLSVFNTMFLGLDVEELNNFEIFGYSGGVSYMYQNDEGKRFIKTISNLEYLK